MVVLQKPIVGLRADLGPSNLGGQRVDEHADGAAGASARAGGEDGAWPVLPQEGDTERPNVARMYDHLLGGAHNFAPDRDMASRLLLANPDTARGARANRAFLRRAVRWCVRAGVEQFLDLGSGLPTVGTVHQLAHELNPGARVAYVDLDPVAVAVSRALLRDDPRVGVTQADLRDSDTTLALAGDVLRLDRPVAVLAVSVLHFLPGDLAAILTPYRRRLVPGSVLALSHGSTDHDDPELAARCANVFSTMARTGNPLVDRDRAQLRAALDGTRLVAPGLADVTAWPGPTGDAPIGMYAAVARHVSGSPGRRERTAG